MAIHITGDDAADQVLTDDPFALLVGMMLDQQYPMEHAFRGPAKVLDRFGTLEPAAIAAADPEEFAALLPTPPAVHRFPGSMAARIQALARIVEEEYDGRRRAAVDRGGGRQGPAQADAGAARASASRRRRSSSPCSPSSSAYARRAGRRPSATTPRTGYRSVADVVDPASLQKVRDFKKAEEGRGQGGHLSRRAECRSRLESRGRMTTAALDVTGPCRAPNGSVLTRGVRVLERAQVAPRRGAHAPAVVALIEQADPYRQRHPRGGPPGQ